MRVDEFKAVGYGPEKDFFIKRGYIHRKCPIYFEDNRKGIVYQPHVYEFAGYLGKLYSAKYIIDVGCGSGQKLAMLYSKFKIIGIDFGPNIKNARQKYPFGLWIEWNLDDPGQIPIPEDILAESVIICADVIEHLGDPSYLLSNLKSWMDYAPVCLISTPERDLVRGDIDFGPPANPAHVREWNIREFERLLLFYGFNIEFLGLTVNNNIDLEKKTILAVIGKNRRAEFNSGLVDGFRVIAFMTCYNEQDIIIPSLAKLIQQRIEFLANEFEADWFIHHDVDEIRMSPWSSLTYKEGIFRVDKEDFNCIDHTVLAFYPVDNQYPDGGNFEEHFRYFDFGRRPGHFLQIKAWKNLGKRISLAESGGHEVRFEGRKV